MKYRTKEWPLFSIENINALECELEELEAERDQLKGENERLRDKSLRSDTIDENTRNVLSGIISELKSKHEGLLGDGILDDGLATQILILSRLCTPNADE